MSMALRLNPSALPSTSTALLAVSMTPIAQPRFQSNWMRLAPRHVDPAGEAPIPGRHLVDHHVGRRIGRRVPDGDDGLVDALDDVAALLPRERAFRHVDLGYWHVGLHPRYQATLCLA